MARSLLKLAVYFEKGSYRGIAQRSIEVMGDLPVKYSSAFANWSILRLEMVKGPVSAVFVGKDNVHIRRNLGKSFLPFVTMAAYHPELPLSALHKQQHKDDVFICTGHTCYPPTDSIEEMEQLLNNVD